MSGGLVLIGLSGSGKSTVGREVAAALGLPLLDTDRLIEREAGCTVADLFTRHGERHFRALEMAAVARACAGRAVVATGGGAVLQPANRAAMRAGNLVVWLDPPLTLLVARLDAQERREVRPLLAGDTLRTLQRLHDERQRLYAEAAHVRIGDDPAHAAGSGQIAEMLVTLYRTWCAKEAAG